MILSIPFHWPGFLVKKELGKSASKNLTPAIHKNFLLVVFRVADSIAPNYGR